MQWKPTCTPCFFFISFTRIFLWTLRTISYIFLCRVSISRVMNAKQKKNSKFEWEDKSNGIPLLQHRFLLPFTAIFLWTFWTIPYIFSLCRVSICGVMNAKKSRNSRERNTILIVSLQLVLLTSVYIWKGNNFVESLLYLCL